jgi:hypothetical protein
MDNYNKKRGRQLCKSCHEDGDPNTRIVLTNHDPVVALNEQTLLGAIDAKWNHQLYEWAKAGTVLGPKKHHNPPNWMNFELVLTKKKRKKKALPQEPRNMVTTVWMRPLKEKKVKTNGKKH